MPTQQRRRGAVLTPKGLHKLQDAKQQAEFNKNCNKRFTLDDLSYQTGLDTHTLCKIFRRDSKVDTQSLTRCFQAFQLLLEPDDYEIPMSPPFITSCDLQQRETDRNKTLERQDEKEPGLKLKLDVNEDRLPMTAPEEIRQRGITVLKELSGESLVKAVKLLESFSQESSRLSENKLKNDQGVAQNIKPS
ncbi:hypothetical protein H6G80_09295 [Nostoc sp. FACHB-87]|uniref:hypothetical protein n=1 Tax=Nostocaceae TaxID=1162 RepID=UPI001684712E|nr:MULTISPECIES: hypothetical protein [Nostocaceae]MBD2454273.1 hypothetical protein [Nostoc sp. FACHB-87]MBD2474134.1 hypothetical protein [Anabaena sp. FACHB-83]